ncbi:MAG TPA: hypothetical protein VGD99_20600, partial [Anaerolineae bacterium]
MKPQLTTSVTGSQSGEPDLIPTASKPKVSSPQLFRHFGLNMTLFILIIYTVLTLGLTYPLLFNLTRSVPNDIGDPLLNTWILAWDSQALLTDPLDLFQANIFYPLPNTLAYSEHLLSTAVLVLPLQLIFGEPVLAYNLSLLATFPLAALGMYLLALHWTGRRSAAFVAGLVFAFNPYRFAAIAHLQLLTFQWLPFGLVLLDLALKGRDTGSNRKRPVVIRTSYFLGAGIFLVLQLLASWYLALYTGLILGIYLFASFFSGRFDRSRLPGLVSTLLISGLLALPLGLPYLALVDELRQARPLSLAISLAAAPSDFLAAAPFNQLFGPLTKSFRQRPNFTEEHMLFSGIVAPLLGLVGLIAVVRSHIRRTASRPSGATSPRLHEARRALHAPATILSLLIIVALSLIISFPGPYTVLTNFLPFTTIIRVPARWLIPALFGLSGLAAFGYACLDHRLTPIPHPRSPISHPPSQIPHLTSPILLIICTILLITETLSIPLPLAPVENHEALNPAYHHLAASGDDVALVELPLHSAPAPEFPEVKRLYASTLGWWQLVNGYSGYTPPRQPELARTLAGFPDERSINALTALATDNPIEPNAPGRSVPLPLFLLVHPAEAPLNRTEWETSTRWQAERNPTLRPMGQFNGDYLYQVIPLASQTLPTSPLATFGPNPPIQLISITNYQSPISNDAQLNLHWQTTTAISTAYTVFIHLRAADGFVRSQADGPPVSGHYPTDIWPPDEIIQDIHPLPPDDVTQIDHLAIGLYDPATGERLPAYDLDGQRLPDDAL